MDSKIMRVAKFISIVLVIQLGITILSFAGTASSTNIHQISTNNIEKKVTKIWNKYLGGPVSSLKDRDKEIEEVLHAEEKRVLKTGGMPRYKENQQLVENIKKSTIEKEIGKREQQWLKCKEKYKYEEVNGIIRILEETNQPVIIKNQQLRGELVTRFEEKISYLYEAEVSEERISATRNKIAQLKTQSLSDETVPRDTPAPAVTVPGLAPAPSAAMLNNIPVEVTPITVAIPSSTGSPSQPNATTTSLSVYGVSGGQSAAQISSPDTKWAGARRAVRQTVQSAAPQPRSSGRTGSAKGFFTRNGKRIPIN